MEISLREMSILDLEVIKDWYTRIDGVLYTSRYGPKKFNGRDAIRHEEYVWYIIIVSEVDCGVIWLEKEEIFHDTAILGIMIGKINYFGKGIGKKAISLAMSQSREHLNFSQVCLHVRKTNTRAIRCYTKYGFCINGEGEKIGIGGKKWNFLR